MGTEIDFKGTYLTDHLITYIGNKRRLLQFINTTVDEIKQTIGDHLSFFDGFSGSGCVARLFKHYAAELYVNDLENYSVTLNRCYLANASEVPQTEVNEYIDRLNTHKLDEQPVGFIQKNYSPANDNDIQPGERVFFTNTNARIIDNMRRMIEPANDNIKPFLLAPLLVKASIHNNTSGVFKGFHKKDGIGHFGGAGENALARIKREINLDHPIYCSHECETHFIQGDINKVVEQVPKVDVVYFDPPYNQHPYGSNYFMLNIIADYNEPPIQDGVSGITIDWNRSAYNKRQEAEQVMDHLVGRTKAKIVLISYNNEGIIPIDRFADILNRHGAVHLRRQKYTTYRGSKNLGKNKVKNDGTKRNIQVEELLWVLQKAD